MELKNFNGKLNTSMFTNIEKSLNSTELGLTYPTSKFFHFEEKAIRAYAQEAVNASTSELVKAMGQDGDAILKKAEEEFKELKRVLIVDDKGEERTIFIKAKTENEASNNIEKGAMSDALFYDTKFSFKKTGKEIKEKMSAMCAKFEAQKTILSTKLDTMLDELPCVPTRTPSDYIFRGFAIDSDYKLFEYNQCYFYEKMESNSNAMAVGEIQPASNKEDAKICNDWNSAVEKYFDTCVEIKSCETLEENLDDKKSYELTPRQLITFGFN